MYLFAYYLLSQICKKILEKYPHFILSFLSCNDTKINTKILLGKYPQVFPKQISGKILGINTSKILRCYSFFYLAMMLKLIPGYYWENTHFFFDTKFWRNTGHKY